MRLGREGVIFFQGVPRTRSPAVYTVGPATTSGQACQRGMFLFKRTSIQGEPVVYQVVCLAPAKSGARISSFLTLRKEVMINRGEVRM